MKVDANWFQWMKVGKKGWNWMKVDKYECIWLKVNKSWRNKIKKLIMKIVHNQMIIDKFYEIWRKKVYVSRWKSIKLDESGWKQIKWEESGWK